MSKTFAFAAVCALALLTGECALAQTVSVRSGGHTKPPISSVVIYRATCPDAVYSLEFDRKNKGVRFRPGETADTIDMTISSLGQVFLSNRLYGNIALNCADHDLNVFFVGYKLTTAGISPVSYTVNIDKSGALSHNEGLRDETEDYVLHKAMP